jgi:hypothetical protein
MIVERQSNGSLLISDTVGNDWIKKVYYFYSKKEAIKLFREYRREVKNEKTKTFISLPVKENIIDIPKLNQPKENNEKKS